MSEENGLHGAIGRESGPLGLPTSPSGKNGRERLPPERSAKAKVPVSALESPRNVRTLPTKACTSVLGSASSSAPARAPEKNVAVRAFCSETSVPKSGASGARTTPSTCRSEEHTSELQSLMRISYAVFCLKKKKHKASQKQIP